MATFLNWNWASDHVQAELQNGEYVSAESTLILAGPSRLKMITAMGGDPLAAQSQLYPIGLLQMLTIAQNRQVARLFEIGSKRSYFVPGRLFANFQMNRILFYGPSLLRLLYAIAPTYTYGKPFNFVAEGVAPSAQSKLKQNPLYTSLFPEEVYLAPGYGADSTKDNRDFYINLASELFNVPFGMCVLFKDARKRPYGAFYAEECMIEAHSMGVDSNNIVIAEGVNGQFDLVQPIQVHELTKATA
jgi:hypothetical protein